MSPRVCVPGEAPIRRIVALGALALGALGVVVAVLFGVWSVRLLVGAGSFASDALQAVSSAVDRAAATLAEAPEERPEVLARVGDNLSAAREALEAVRNHPLVVWLPLDFSELEASLRGAAAAGGESVAAARAEIGDRVGLAADRIDDLGDDIRVWTRLAALALVLAAGWGAVGQVLLFKWGWGRARTPKAVR